MRLFAVSAALAPALAALFAAPSATAQDADNANAAPPAGTFAAVLPAASDFGRAQAALVSADYARAARLFAPLADGALNPRVSLMAGFAHLGAGKTLQAETYFHRALRRDSRNPLALQGLGLAAVARGDRDAARMQLDRIERVRATCTGTCSRSAEFESAAASLRRAIG